MVMCWIVVSGNIFVKKVNCYCGNGEQCGMRGNFGELLYILHRGNRHCARIRRNFKTGRVVFLVGGQLVIFTCPHNSCFFGKNENAGAKLLIFLNKKYSLWIWRVCWACCLGVNDIHHTSSIDIWFIITNKTVSQSLQDVDMHSPDHTPVYYMLILTHNPCSLTHTYTLIPF